MYIYMLGDFPVRVHLDRDPARPKESFVWLSRFLSSMARGQGRSLKRGFEIFARGYIKSYSGLLLSSFSLVEQRSEAPARVLISLRAISVLEGALRGKENIKPCWNSDRHWPDIRFENRSVGDWALQTNSKNEISKTQEIQSMRRAVDCTRQKTAVPLVWLAHRKLCYIVICLWGGT